MGILSVAVIRTYERGANPLFREAPVLFRVAIGIAVNFRIPVFPEHTTLSASNPDAPHSYETEFMGDGRKLSFPWRYSFSLNEIMYRYIGFGFILPYEATKQSSSINNCSIIPTESCWARS